MFAEMCRLASVAGCLLASAGGAGAHVTLEVKEAKVGAGYKAVLGVPHGCDGAATTEVSVDIPEGVIAVKPMPKPGWTLALKQGPYARSYAFYHGETKSEGVKQVTWSGGELPDAYFDQFVLSTFVAGELAFPVTQKCAATEVRWSEVAAAGQDPHGLPHPAPTLRLVADEGAEHHQMEHAMPTAGIDVSGAWTRPASAGGIGVGYAKITNQGSDPDTLVGAASDAAERVELHETTISSDGVASMKKVDSAEIGPGQSIELKPGGMHLMLIGLKSPIAAGDKVKAKLEFKKKGAVEVEFTAQAAAPAAAGGEHEHMHHH